MKKTKLFLFGILAGCINGLFGSGGGLIVVPLLKSFDLPVKKAHATSVAIILPLSALSAAILLFSGVTPDYSAFFLWILPAGLVGALIGAFVLKKINVDFLRIVFACIMIFSAVRILLR